MTSSAAVLSRVVAGIAILASGGAPWSDGAETIAGEKLSNEALTVAIDARGCFTMQTSQGRWLLFPGYTGFVSLRVDGQAARGGKDAGLTVRGQRRLASEDAVLTTFAHRGVELEQEIRLLGEMARIRWRAANCDSVPHDVELRCLLDTQIDANDGSPLYTEATNVRTSETDIPSPRFAQWRAYDQWPNPGLTAFGVFETPPQRLVLGWWPKAKDSVWEYTPRAEQTFYQPGETRSPKSDSCVLAYFALGRLASGQAASVTLYYGTGKPKREDAPNDLRDALAELEQVALGALDTYADRFARGNAAVIERLRSLYAEDAVRAAAFIVELVSAVYGRTPKVPGKGLSPQMRKWARYLRDSLGTYERIKLGFDAVGFANTIEEVLSSDETHQKLKTEWDGDKLKRELEAALRSCAEGRVSLLQPTCRPYASSGLAGARQAIRQRIQAYTATAESRVPSGYPTKLAAQRVRMLAADLRDASARETVILPLQDFEGAGLNLVFGSSATCQAGLQTLLGQHSTAETAEWLGLVGGVGGGILKIAVAIKTVSISFSAELALSGGAAVADITTRAVKMSLEEQLGAMAERLSSASLTDASRVAWSVHLLLDSLSAEGLPQEPPSNDQWEFGPPRVPDVILPAQGRTGVVAASWEVTNRNREAFLATAHLLVYRSETFDQSADNSPLMLATASPRAVPPGRATTFDFECPLPDSAEVRAGGYVAEFYVDSGPCIAPWRAGPAVARFRVQSTWRMPITTYLQEMREPGLHRVGPPEPVPPAGPRPPAPITGSTTWSVPISSRVQAGQSRQGDYLAAPTAVETEFMLLYPGSDLDLHVYDAAGRRVGVRYDTGAREVAIPGAWYSGPSVRPEVIRVPSKPGQRYRVEVVGVATRGDEPFSVLATDFAHQPPVFWCGAAASGETYHGSPGRTAVASVYISEVGNRRPLPAIQASLTDLRGRRGVIPRESTTIECPTRPIPPGGLGCVTLNTEVPTEAGFGEYAGQLTITCGDKEVGVPVRLVVEPAPRLRSQWAARGTVRTWVAVTLLSAGLVVVVYVVAAGMLLVLITRRGEDAHEADAGPFFDAGAASQQSSTVQGDYPLLGASR